MRLAESKIQWCSSSLVYSVSMRHVLRVTLGEWGPVITVTNSATTTTNPPIREISRHVSTEIWSVPFKSSLIIAHNWVKKDMSMTFSTGCSILKCSHSVTRRPFCIFDWSMGQAVILLHLPRSVEIHVRTSTIWAESEPAIRVHVVEDQNLNSGQHNVKTLSFVPSAKCSPICCQWQAKVYGCVDGRHLSGAANFDTPTGVRLLIAGVKRWRML